MIERRALTVVAAAALFFAACGEHSTTPPHADASALPDAAPFEPDAEIFPDAIPQEAGPPPDAGVLFNQRSCKPCNGGCDQAHCLQLGAPINESYCVDDCASDQLGCVDGFSCYNVNYSVSSRPLYFCLPPQASCKASGVGYGTACYGDTSACLALQNVCEGDQFALGYCTDLCSVDSDCPPAFACGTGLSGTTVCKPRFLGGADRCARDMMNDLPCAVDADCAAMNGARCLHDEPTLAGVCVSPCGSGCGSGDACLHTELGPMCLSDNCACHGSPVAAGTRDLLKEALANSGLTRCSVTYSVYDWTQIPQDIVTDPYRLSFFDGIHNEPLRGPPFAMSLVKDLDHFAQNAQQDPAFRAARMVERLATLVDRPVKKRMPGTIDMASPLASAVIQLITTAGGAPNRQAIAADAMHVAMPLQLALAPVIDAMSRAVEARAAAASSTLLMQLYDYGPAFVVPRADGFGLAPAMSSVEHLLNDQFSYGDMYGAATDLLDAIAEANLSQFRVTPTTTTATTAVLLFSQDTPIGRIAIGDGQSGIYDSRRAAFAGPWALLLDLGGDDVYRTPVAGNVSVQNSVSVLIDLGGDDQYTYVEVPDLLDGMRLPSDGAGRYHPMKTPDMDDGPISLSDIPRQGGARVGTAILVDLGQGKDSYRSLRMSQGSGMFGAGVLVDDGGDDTYVGEAHVQGAGEFGIGILLDLGGSDVHKAYSMAQGFAYARASGLLYDVAGDDKYLMDVGDPMFGGDPLYFNAQRPGKANTTTGQGFGFGRRADMTDRAFMSGGVGILVDAAGNDQYEGSIFAQGGGFWFGTGILADESGNDQYDSMWYGMGAGAHYALAFLLEGGGDDVYGVRLPRINVTIGGGHDFTAAFLIDESGNDTYNGPRITMGGGYTNGMGFFVDNAGDDHYNADTAFSFGAAGLGLAERDSMHLIVPTFFGDASRKVKAIGVFIDAGGTDTFQRMMMPPMGIADDQQWLQEVPSSTISDGPADHGTGIDGTGDSTLHAKWP
jgi:hypothetical protein